MTHFSTGSAKRRRVRWSWIGLLLASVIVGAAPQPGEAQSFSLTQITNTVGGGNILPAISANGARVVFLSNRDVTPGSPGNADGNLEVFLFDVATAAITQITNTVGGGIGGGGAFAPSINATGTRIAFVSDRDLTPGNPGNPDGNAEIFLFDTTTGHFTQVTNSPFGCINITPSINADGNRIAFSSDCDLRPGNPGNPDHNFEIFFFETTGGGLLAQLTNTTGGGNFTPSVSANGLRIAFSSNRNLTPGNPGNADGNAEIFLFDTATGITQLTNTTGGGNVGPSISAAGSRIAFFSDRDLTPGNPGNVDGNAEVFVLDTTSRRFTQITNTTGGTGSFLQLSLSGAGTQIVFASDRDVTPGRPGNADGNVEIFRFDTGTGLFTQITSTTGGNNFTPAISADGSRIAFISDRNLTPGRPGNADGNFEVFLAEVSSGPQNIPTLSGWVQLLVVALLLITGLRALRGIAPLTRREARSR
jgi:Tol biopolymer transport system component